MKTRNNRYTWIGESLEFVFELIFSVAEGLLSALF
jgi:hypothetical protein